jgi:hypothetical protein
LCLSNILHSGCYWLPLFPVPDGKKEMVYVRQLFGMNNK